MALEARHVFHAGTLKRGPVMTMTWDLPTHLRGGPSDKALWGRCKNASIKRMVTLSMHLELWIQSRLAER